MLAHAGGPFLQGAGPLPHGPADAPPCRRRRANAAVPPGDGPRLVDDCRRVCPQRPPADFRRGPAPEAPKAGAIATFTGRVRAKDHDEDAAARMVAGTARSMGLRVTGRPEAA